MAGRFLLSKNKNPIFTLNLTSTPWNNPGIAINLKYTMRKNNLKRRKFRDPGLYPMGCKSTA